MTFSNVTKDRNWPAYNQALCARGNVFRFFTARVLRAWKEVNPANRVVGQPLYPDAVIQCCLQIGQVFKQALRQTTGLLRGLLDAIGFSHLPVPDYSTLSRRSKSITVQPVYPLWSDRSKNVAGDSTGLKVAGEGEWKVRKHGYSKRRTWMKMHLFVDVDTQIIVYSILTHNDVDDGEVAVEFFTEAEESLKRFYGDGAYDKAKVREAAHQAGSEQIIPPRKDAVLDKEKRDFMRERDFAIDHVMEAGGKEWKKESGYHKRSLSETAMFRYKTIIGEKLRALNFESQVTEMKIGIETLNFFRRNIF